MLSDEQKALVKKVGEIKASGKSWAKACAEAGISANKWNYLRRAWLEETGEFSERSKAQRGKKRGPRQKVAKAGSYVAMPIAQQLTSTNLTIPLTSDPKGPVVMIFGTQTQLSELLRGAMTR